MITVRADHQYDPEFLRDRSYKIALSLCPFLSIESIEKRTRVLAFLSHQIQSDGLLSLALSQFANRRVSFVCVVMMREK